jgi:tRNA1(Val) A37 N6-methylase TrmN6
MTFVSADTETPPSMVLLECIKGGASGMSVTPPLILYREPAGRSPNRQMTEEALRVYETCALYPQQKKKAEDASPAHHHKGETST